MGGAFFQTSALMALSVTTGGVHGVRLMTGSVLPTQRKMTTEVTIPSQPKTPPAGRPLMKTAANLSDLQGRAVEPAPPAMGARFTGATRGVARIVFSAARKWVDKYNTTYAHKRTYATYAWIKF